MVHKEDHMQELTNNDLAIFGLWFMNSLDKTASADSKNSLAMEAYVNGIDTALGLDTGYNNTVKTASKAVGREFMFNVASMFMLNK